MHLFTICFYNNSLKNSYKFNVEIKHKLSDFNFLINNEMINNKQININDPFTLSIDKFSDNDYNYKWLVYYKDQLLTTMVTKEITLSLSQEGIYSFILQIYTLNNQIEKELSLEVTKTIAQELKLYYNDSLI